MLNLILSIISAIFPNFYLSGMPVFKKPLSQKEEQMWVKRLEQGDKEAKKVLIEHNLRLVAHVVKKYNVKEQNIDDMISIGTIGLIKAINSFKNDKAIRLATYAARCIENEILMSLRSEKKHMKDISLNESVGQDKDGNEISLIEVLSNEDEDIIRVVERISERESLYRYVEELLTEREKEIITMRYGIMNTKKLTQIEIANKLGISRSYVSRIEKRALLKLREVFLKEPKRT